MHASRLYETVSEMRTAAYMVTFSWLTSSHWRDSKIYALGIFFIFASTIIKPSNFDCWYNLLLNVTRIILVNNFVWKKLNYKKVFAYATITVTEKVIYVSYKHLPQMCSQMCQSLFSFNTLLAIRTPCPNRSIRLRKWIYSLLKIFSPANGLQQSNSIYFSTYPIKEPYSIFYIA